MKHEYNCAYCSYLCYAYDGHCIPCVGTELHNGTVTLYSPNLHCTEAHKGQLLIGTSLPLHSSIVPSDFHCFLHSSINSMNAGQPSMSSIALDSPMGLAVPTPDGTARDIPHHPLTESLVPASLAIPMSQ